ncbi:MAG: transposase [Candidatus Pacebacteria bacterium]|nr:transposase [Candidatus Paceibacterota bacterium]
MNRKISFAIDEYYHLYNRGTDKRKIFLDHSDYQRFIRLLYLCNTNKSILLRDIPIGDTYVFDRGETIVDIGSYCLMPNHFHILAKEKIEGGISLFMKKVSTAYSMYFNLKNKRSGRLFEDAFKAQYIDQDEHLRYLFAYIHLNPVKLFDGSWKEKGLNDPQKAKDFLSKYHYSSYLDYLDYSRAEKVIIDRSVFPGYFGEVKDFNDYLHDWLTYTEVTPME